MQVRYVFSTGVFITQKLFSKISFLHSYFSVLNTKIIFCKEFDYHFLDKYVSEYFLIPVLCFSIEIKSMYTFFSRGQETAQTKDLIKILSLCGKIFVTGVLQKNCIFLKRHLFHHTF